MFSIAFDIQGWPAMKASQRNRMWREIWRQVGRSWRNKNLKRHFTRAGARKYGYALRKGERPGQRPLRGTYTGRKLAEKGHTRPLEWSGDSKQRALSQEKLTPTRLRVKIRLPQGFNRKHPASKVVMRDEIRATTADEITQLEQVWLAEAEKRLRRAKASTKITVRAV